MRLTVHFQEQMPNFQEQMQNQDQTQNFQDQMQNFQVQKQSYQVQMRRFKEEEPEWHMTTPEQERRSKSVQDTWDRLVEQERDIAAQSLTFVEVVSDRTVPKVLEAIARIYSRLRRWGLPYVR